MSRSHMSVSAHGIPDGVERGKTTYALANVRDNRLLGRREVTVDIWHLGAPTPTRLEIREWVSSTLGVPLDVVYVRSVATEYGVGHSVAEVHVYDAPETANAVEPLYVRIRNMPKEQAKALRDELAKKRAMRKKK